MTDNREIATRSEGSALVDPAQTTPVERMFQQVMMAATNPDVDASKMTALVDLQMRMMDYQKLEQFNADKVAAIIAMPSISKRGRIIIPGKDGRPPREQGRFAKFEDLHKIVTPILARHNLVLTFNLGHNQQLVTVQPILSHANGYVEKGEFMSLPLDTSGSKNNTQGAGSASSYGKRYAMCAMLNIVTHDEDDDGNGGIGQATPQDRITAEQQAVIDAARSAAMGGMAEYEKHFRSLPPHIRGWLVSEPYHDQNKVAAANVDRGSEGQS